MAYLPPHEFDRASARPLIGVLCSNDARKRQAVASRFVEPLRALSGASVLLVPALGAEDAPALAGRLDALLLTGSRTHVAPHRYGSAVRLTADELDEARDEVALALAGAMVEAGRPVFGICRGLQEINVLFGGTLRAAPDAGRHRGSEWGAPDETLFAHRHDVALNPGGELSRAVGAASVSVVSAHEQGVDRLGSGLAVEAVDPGDGLVEAVSARPCGGDVLAVQWHPEWDAHASAASRAFFRLLGAAARGGALVSTSKEHP